MAQGLTYENHLDAQTPKWFAVYTRYKREKLVVKALEEKGIHVFLPLQKIQRQWERKKRTVELPLINCYVFVKIVKRDYISVLESEYVLRFLQFSKNLISIPEAEIELIKRIIDSGINVEAEEITYQAGDLVEITSGSLAGLRGKLIDQQGKNKLIVELQYIGYALRLQVHADIVIKAPVLL